MGKHRHVRYSFSCDDCGKESEEYGDKVQLMRDLEDEGWVLESDIQGNQYCSDCKG